MRWSLAKVALATTAMVAVAFLVPLALVVEQIARAGALATARQQATAMVAALAVTDDREALARAVASSDAGAAGRLALYLPGDAPATSRPTGSAVGTPHVPAADVALAAERGEALTSEVPGGVAYLQPTAIADGRTAVIEVFVPDSALERGVRPAWLALSLVAIVLVGGSVLVADRLGARMVKSARELAAAARRLGRDDLTARVTPAGPAELTEAGAAFNAMADRISDLVRAERELAADLSHRLRTPLTALRLDTETLGDGPEADRMRRAVAILEAEVDDIIHTARRTTTEAAQPGCDLTDVLADRLAFWAALAEDHGRPWTVVAEDRPIRVQLPRDEATAAIDALLGNVFEHTPQSTPFRVTLDGPTLVVEDAGPGIADPEAARRRGTSHGGSTGLGLSIVERIGAVRIDRSALGGARVEVTFPTPA